MLYKSAKAQIHQLEYPEDLDYYNNQKVEIQYDSTRFENLLAKEEEQRKQQEQEQLSTYQKKLEKKLLQIYMV